MIPEGARVGVGKGKGMRPVFWQRWPVSSGVRMC